MTVQSPALEQIIRDLVSRIVQAVYPRRIILFGSAARGRMGPHSDLDVLVVMPEGVHRRETERRINRALLRLGVPTDVVVATEKDVEQLACEESLVICPAVREGKEIYRAE